MFKPLRIDFELGWHVVAPQHPLHLDGLLADVAGAFPGDAGDLSEVIERESRDGEWCYKASAIEFDVNARYQRCFTRKHDDQHVLGLISEGLIGTEGRRPMSKISTTAGPWRGYLLAHQVMDTRKAVAWAVGDQDAISELLDKVHGLGSHRRNNMGRVTGFEVAVDEAAKDRWKNRVLPWNEADRVAVAATATPPYFERNRVVAGSVPERWMKEANGFF